MADITYSIIARVSDGYLTDSVQYSNITANMATAGVLTQVLDLGTSVSTVSTAQISAAGLCFARSLATESTHTVTFGSYDGTSLHSTVRLRAGEPAVFRLAEGNYAANAAVEGSRLLLQIFED